MALQSELDRLSQEDWIWSSCTLRNLVMRGCELAPF